MKKLQEKVKYIFFSFVWYPRRQRVGILFMLALVVLTVVTTDVMVATEAPTGFATTDLTSDLRVFEKNLDSVNFSEQTDGDWETFWTKKYSKIQLFEFDPNTASNKEFIALGLSEKQVKIIDNFRKKGGKFRSKSDFGKLYGLPEAQFEILAPYVRLSDDFAPEIPQKQGKSFVFDPNSLSVDSFMLLGLSEKQASAIDNFRKKGGFFKTNDDFKKSFVITPEFYAKVENYIAIQPKKIAKNVESVQIFDLNTATASELASIRGIGEYASQRVVEYREKLGGYVSLEQLGEIRGLRPEMVEALRAHITLKTKDLTLVDINHATLDKLGGHPYIGFRLGKEIVARREMRGFFSSVEQLRSEKLVTLEKFEQLKPYLVVKF